MHSLHKQRTIVATTYCMVGIAWALSQFLNLCSP